MSADDASIVGDVLIEANLRGHDSHGVVRIPQWVKGLKAGAINARCAPKVMRETAATALIDGDLGLGPVVAMAAVECAAAKAREAGIAMVSVRRASHIGMLQYYTRHLAAEGLIAMAMTNTESGVAPFGGIDPVLGTNPVSCAVPALGVTGTLVMDQEGSKGDFFLAIDPGAVGERDAFLGLTGKLGDDVHASRPAPGADKVMLPGEPEDACRKRRLAEGIPIDDDLIRELEDLAAGA